LPTDEERRQQIRDQKAAEAAAAAEQRKTNRKHGAADRQKAEELRREEGNRHHMPIPGGVEGMTRSIGHRCRRTMHALQFKPEDVHEELSLLELGELGSIGLGW